MPAALFPIRLISRIVLIVNIKHNEPILVKVVRKEISVEKTELHESAGSTVFDYY